MPLTADDRRILAILEERAVADRLVDVGTKPARSGTGDVTWLTFRYLNEINVVETPRRPDAPVEAVAAELLRLMMERLDA